MKLVDLVTEPNGKRYSHTKIWSNIANIIMSVGIAKMFWMGTMTADILMIYAIFVGAASLGSKFLNLKFGMGGDRGSDGYRSPYSPQSYYEQPRYDKDPYAQDSMSKWENNEINVRKPDGV